MAEENQASTPDKVKLAIDAAKPNPAELPAGTPVPDIDALAKIQEYDFPAMKETVDALSSLAELDPEFLKATARKTEDGLVHKGNVLMLPHVNESEVVFVCFYLVPGEKGMKGPFRLNIPHPTT